MGDGREDDLGRDGTQTAPLLTMVSSAILLSVPMFGLTCLTLP